MTVTGRGLVKSNRATGLGVIRQSSDKPQKPRGKPVRISQIRTQNE